MPAHRPHRIVSGISLFCLVVVVLGASGCASLLHRHIDTAPAAHAERDIPNARLLNVDIAVFDPGIPANPDSDSRIFPDVRKAEARYMPVALRDTLQDTGYWGAVRVVPEPVAYAELAITGRILDSSGLALKLKIHAQDASGRVWLDKVYQTEAAEHSYSGQPASKAPFRGVYNRIADDLLAARRDLEARQLRAIRQISEMRFAGDLAPERFDRYLARSGDRYRLKGLPARGDPMLARIDTIRARDYAVVDALDRHYRLFHDRIASAYNDWRQSSFTEAKQVRKLRRQAWRRKLFGALAVAAGVFGLTQSRTPLAGLGSQAAILGGAVLFGSGVEKGKEVKIHAEALKELGQSLAADVKPRIVKLAGHTVTLSGSAKEQFNQWRALLKNLYEEQTGFAPGGDAATQQSR